MIVPHGALASFAAAVALVGGAHAQAAPHDSVAPLPTPTGPHAVGTTSAWLVDAARTDAEFRDGRPIRLQLWYPRAAGATGATAPYLDAPALDSVLIAQGYYDVDTTALAAWRGLATHARRDAAPAKGRFPLVTFAVGLGVIGANYTSLAEELASHGVVFALVESPLAGTMLLPDGRVVQDTAGRTDSAAGHRGLVEEWARDVSVALDRLQHPDTRTLPAAGAAVARTVDWRRIAAAGHSSGGLVAIAAAGHDGRVRAAIDLDGGLSTPEGEPLAEFVPRGVPKPTLLLRSRPRYSDADFERRHLTRAEWERRGAAGQAALADLAARSAAPLWIAAVSGTGHFSFSDAPFVMPSTITRFGGRIIAPARGWQVVTATMLAFLDESLGRRHGALADAARAMPELGIDHAPAHR